MYVEATDTPECCVLILENKSLRGRLVLEGSGDYIRSAAEWSKKI